MVCCGELEGEKEKEKERRGKGEKKAFSLGAERERESSFPFFFFLFCFFPFSLSLFLGAKAKERAKERKEKQQQRQRKNPSSRRRRKLKNSKLKKNFQNSPPPLLIPQQIEAAWAVADRLGLIGPCCEQPQYNLLERAKVEREFLPLFETRGTGTTTWSPLASGVLTGKYGASGVVPPGSRLSIEKYKKMLESKLAPEVLEKVEKLRPIAEKKLNCSLAQLAIAFCASNENVSTVLLGATSESQLEDNLGALAVIPKLTPEVMEEIEAVMGTKPEPARRFR